MRRLTEVSQCFALPIQVWYQFTEFRTTNLESGARHSRLLLQLRYSASYTSNLILIFYYNSTSAK